jgi:hypothetical protein
MHIYLTKGKRMKKILIVAVAAMVVGCGQDAGFNSTTIGKELDKGIATVQHNGRQLNKTAIEKYKAAERKGDLAVDHVKRGGKDANMVIIEKRNAAEKKGDENGKATEDKFHETKDSMTKRATGFDRDAQATKDAEQDDRLVSLDGAVSLLSSNISDLESELLSSVTLLNQAIINGDTVVITALTEYVTSIERSIEVLEDSLGSIEHTVDTDTTCSITGRYKKKLLTCGGVSVVIQTYHRR